MPQPALRPADFRVRKNRRGGPGRKSGHIVTPLGTPYTLHTRADGLGLTYCRKDTQTSKARHPNTPFLTAGKHKIGLLGKSADNSRVPRANNHQTTILGWCQARPNLRYSDGETSADLAETRVDNYDISDGGDNFIDLEFQLRRLKYLGAHRLQHNPDVISVSTQCCS